MKTNKKKRWIAIYSTRIYKKREQKQAKIQRRKSHTNQSKPKQMYIHRDRDEEKHILKKIVIDMGT